MSMPPPEMPNDPTPGDPTQPPGPPTGPQTPPPPQYGQPGPQQNWAPPQQGYPYGPFGANPGAPYGYDPVTGIPFSDKSKLIAGLLQIFLPFGVGRFYMGDTGIGVAQLLVTIFTCGLASLWSLIDGVLILINGGTDAQGRPLRDGT